MIRTLFRSPLLFICLFFSPISNGQIAGPLPDTCGRYEHSLWNWDGTVSETFHYTYDPSLDTFIGGASYTKLIKYTYDDTGGSYIGAVRESNSKVLYVPPDSNGPELLWDFSVAVNDTVRGLFAFNYVVPGQRLYYDPIITGKDTLVNSGDSLLSFEYELLRKGDSNNWDSTSFSWGHWTEWRGSGRGLLLIDPWNTVSGGTGFNRLCLADSNQSFFDYCSDCHCPECPSDHTSIEAHGSSEERISIHPNPASERIHVKFPHRQKGRSMSLRTLDLQGRTLLERRVQKRELELSLDSFEPGVYLLKAESPEGELYVERFVVK